jgi:hypothetical protein
VQPPGGLQTEAGPAFSQSLNRGVGHVQRPQRHGKTLVARALASLQMDLYRVHCPAVNKYIGETERNLNQAPRVRRSWT